MNLSATPAIRTFKKHHFYLELNKKDDFSEISRNIKNSRGVQNCKNPKVSRGPPKFPIFIKTGSHLFWNSRELWSSQLVKMQEYTCFPKFTRPKSYFSPKNVDHNFWFLSKSGPHLFWNSRELGSPQWAKIQEYTRFPKFTRHNSYFSPKNVDHNF